MSPVKLKPPRRLAQPVGILVWVEHGAVVLLFHSVVPQHLIIDPHILALHRKRSLGCLGIDDEVIIAVWAVFVAVVELLGVLAEALLALLAGKDHFEALQKGVFFLLAMAFGAVKPFSALGIIMSAW